jgi:hypothetical protein
MKVFVALRSYAYEGSEILGISLEKNKVEALLDPNIEVESLGCVTDSIREYELI